MSPNKTKKKQKTKFNCAPVLHITLSITHICTLFYTPAKLFTELYTTLHHHTPQYTTLYYYTQLYCTLPHITVLYITSPGLHKIIVFHYPIFVYLKFSVKLLTFFLYQFAKQRAKSYQGRFPPWVWKQVACTFYICSTWSRPLIGPQIT